MLVQLIYTSTAARDFSDDELAHVLAVAVRNNQKNNVTGLLLYAKGTFLQVIEGESDVIDKLLATIKLDPRHRDINELVRTPIREREFSHWHMGYRALSKSDALALPNFAPFFEEGFDSAVLVAKPGMCLEIMHALAELPA